MPNKLTQNFYCRHDVNLIARELLGKIIYTNIGGELTAGKIIETEAYSYSEKACHAYSHRHTTRTSIMFGAGGHAYVYLCYGIHELFNIVTNHQDTPEAVLIRAVEPVEGWEHMRKRRGTSDLMLTSGPGKLTQALGIDRNLNGINLWGDKIWLEDNGNQLKAEDVVQTTRIGVDYAKEDALLPWRYYVKGNPFVSKK